ncbi:MAG TPA: hypothetical protein DFR83_09165, partial [Deltaproteobacteria bacterium]|nr:hypothetical protein [Deltaproteobacteria bacterium]
MTSSRHTPQTIAYRMLVIGLGTTHIGAAPCALPAASEAALPTTVHVVWGPLKASGDPRVVHHIEHALVPNSPALRCISGEEGELDAYTGPDTLHILWRGLADAERAAAVVTHLQQSIHTPTPTIAKRWAAASAEIAVERALSEPSDDALLLYENSAIHDRYRLNPQGTVRFDPAAVEQALREAPITTVVAMGTAPIQWQRSDVPPVEAATITQLKNPIGAAHAWRVDGALDCTQRRAFWATLTGLAEASGGIPVGWVGHSYGLVGISGTDTLRSPRRRTQAVAQEHDRAVTRSTARRTVDPTDRAWIGVGHLGLGVCPSLPDTPLTTTEVDTALRWLIDAEQPATVPPPHNVGTLDLEAQPRAALWQAGAPPPDWNAHPDLVYIRSPGGFTLEGARETLARRHAEQTLTATTARAVPLETVTEQALVLAGAHTTDVPCRWSGIEPTPACPTNGLLRVPHQDAFFVVDEPKRSRFVQVDIVYALDTDATRSAADVLLGTGGGLWAALDAVGSIRDARVTPEHSRTQLSFTVPIEQLVDVLQAVLVDRRAHPGRGSQSAVGFALDRARQAARAHERSHHPRPQPSAHPGALRAFDQAPRLVVLTGAAAAIETHLDSTTLLPNRVLSAPQLRAEATNLRSEGDPP